MGKTRSYSALFIIEAEKEELIDDVKKAIKTIIDENSGSISGDNIIGKKNLAYPINKKKEGIYYEVAFTADPLSIEKISRLCEINNDIMRTIINLKK